MLEWIKIKGCFSLMGGQNEMWTDLFSRNWLMVGYFDQRLAYASKFVQDLTYDLCSEHH